MGPRRVNGERMIKGRDGKCAVGVMDGVGEAPGRKNGKNGESANNDDLCFCQQCS